MAGPFDLRSVLLARHAQHVVLIHFPIALFLAGVACDLLSRVRSDSRLAAAAHVNLAAAAISVVPAFVTGLLAWRFALEGQRMHGVLLDHFVAASVTMLLISATWITRSRKSQMGSLILELAGVISIALTAHLGGCLSGVNS